MIQSKLLAVAFAASMCGTAAMAQSDVAVPADTTTQSQAVELQPVLQSSGSHPALRVQGMVPNDMVYATAQADTTAVTREQVKAALVAARADGELRADADNSGPVLLDREFMGTRSRDEVKNEIALARADGELNAPADNLPVERVFFVSNTTRAEVKADVAGATHNGMGLSQGDRDHYLGD